MAELYNQKHKNFISPLLFIADCILIYLLLKMIASILKYKFLLSVRVVGFTPLVDIEMMYI